MSIALILMMLSLMIVIPTAFALDSDNVISADANSTVLQNDCYFNANLDNDAGDGSSSNPYRNLTSERITDDSTIHLSDGEYSLDASKTLKNVVIIGENPQNTIINGNGYQLSTSTSLTLFNVTLKNLRIVNSGKFSATNTIFSDCYSQNGGAIYSSSSSSLYLDNATFSNNTASYGGAIYRLNGNMTILNSRFIDNNASVCGGAIYSSNVKNIEINATEFSNNRALSDVGGCIYLLNSALMSYDSSIYNSTAMFGAGIVSVSSNVGLVNLTAKNNKAQYAGGVVYAIYNCLSVNDSYFEDNDAPKGSAVFVNMQESFICLNSTFINNTDCAVYAICGNVTSQNNTFLNDEELLTTVPDLFIANGNYTLFKYNDTEISEIPSYYDLRNLGQVTPVKYQYNGGNCWAFASIAALESAILKATGIAYDFSEENMKNLMALYSEYGWKMATNNGGYTKMGIGYLTSWLGPVNDSDDAYSDNSLFSPVLDSIMHVQNILYLYRDNYTDNDAIKLALMKYGAVATSFYSTGATYQYYTGTNSNNHAVVIVGWNDDLEFSGAPGLGGWIVKNSWGPYSQDHGYFYVSYYDVSFARPGNRGDTYCIVLNDTINFDKNYQYDIPGRTDYFLNSTSTVWYKNKFISTSDEYLVAVSSEFEKNTNWTVSIYVNGDLSHTQSGFSPAGYSTINLDKFIRLNEGDEFEVEFMITVDGDVGVAISESVSLNCELYSQNISFISYDGENWADLYNLEWEYPSHWYDSQVACIKAFTKFINTNLTLVTEYDGFNPVNITALIFDDVGNLVSKGSVSFNFNDEIYCVDVSEGMAKITFNFNKFYNSVSAVFNAIGYISSSDNCTVNISKSNANLTIDVVNIVNDVVLGIHSTDPIYDNATVRVNESTYFVRLVNGNGLLSLYNLTNGNYTVNITLPDTCVYEANLVDSFILDVKNAVIIADDLITSDMGEFTYSAVLFDENSNPIKSKIILFTLNGLNYYETTDNNGMASITTRLDSGNYAIKMTFFDNDYFPYSISKNINVKPYVEFYINHTNYLNSISFAISTSISVNDSFVIKINNVTYVLDDNLLTIDYLANGQYLLELTLFDGADYAYNSFYYNFTINAQTPTIVAGDFSTSYLSNATYPIRILDENSNPVSDCDVIFTLNNETLLRTTDENGDAFIYIDLPNGEYALVITTLENSRYYSSNATRTVLVNSTILGDNPIKASNSNYAVQLLDVNNNPLANATAHITYDGVSSELITNEDGFIYFKLTKVGTFSLNVLNTVTDEVLIRNITVVSRITQNKALIMYYGAGKSYSVRVCNDNGTFEKGLKVTFTLNGKTYTRFTDENGYASLKISLKPGTYTIKATYDGTSVSNRITVKTTIITKNVSVKKGKTIKFNAKLLNSNGKILKNKKITFKFKGKTYNARTNSIGLATLSLKNSYRVGTYTIYTFYGSLIVKNSIKIKK